MPSTVVDANQVTASRLQISLGRSETHRRRAELQGHTPGAHKRVDPPVSLRHRSWHRPIDNAS